MHVTNLNSVQSIVINGEEVERVATFELLSVIFSSDLSWDSHVAFVLSKTAKRMYCIRRVGRGSGRPAGRAGSGRVMNISKFRGSGRVSGLKKMIFFSSKNAIFLLHKLHVQFPVKATFRVLRSRL